MLGVSRGWNKGKGLGVSGSLGRQGLSSLVTFGVCAPRNEGRERLIQSPWASS